MEYLKEAFVSSDRLKRHTEFLFRVGGMYKICNRNLLFHGSIPLTEDGEFMRVEAVGGLSGRRLMDECERRVRAAYASPPKSKERLCGGDFLWFLWCGRGSPLCGKNAVRSFERLLISDKRAHLEKENAYYRAWGDGEVAMKILREFSVEGARAHIINGHVPVRRGESPIKGGGRLIVIDGGFCSAYHERTGIAGYTLIYNADGMRISAHEPFGGKERAVQENLDILSDTAIFEVARDKIRVRECDEGREIRERIGELVTLIGDYRR